MKRVSVIGVLLILFLNFAGFYIYFFVQLSSIKKQMREAVKTMPVEDLTVLRLSLQVYEKVYVEDHEVKVNGKMFDIAKKVQHGNEVVLYGMYDDDETYLMAWLEEFLEQPFHDKNTMPDQILQFITLSFLPSHCEIVFAGSPDPLCITPYLDMESSFLPCAKVPPPRLEAIDYVV